MRKTPSSSSAANMVLVADCTSEEADASESDATDEEADTAAALAEEKILVLFMVGCVKLLLFGLFMELFLLDNGHCKQEQSEQGPGAFQNSEKELQTRRRVNSSELKILLT